MEAIGDVRSRFYLLNSLHHLYLLVYLSIGVILCNIKFKLSYNLSNKFIFLSSNEITSLNKDKNLEL